MLASALNVEWHLIIRKCWYEHGGGVKNYFNVKSLKICTVLKGHKVIFWARKSAK